MISDVTLSSAHEGAPIARDGGRSPGLTVKLGEVRAASVVASAGGEVQGADPNVNQEKRPASAADIHTAVKDINRVIKNIQRDLVFAVDDSTHDVVVKVMDRGSGEVVRQIPAESVLNMRKQLKELADHQSNSGLLLKDKA